MVENESIEKLREHLVKSILLMEKDDLFKLYQATSSIYGEKLSELVTKYWIDNHMNQENLRKAIIDHRAKNPY